MVNKQSPVTYYFHNIYAYASDIEESARFEIPFKFKSSEEEMVFLNCVTKFNRNTLLHLYIKQQLLHRWSIFFFESMSDELDIFMDDDQFDLMEYRDLQILFDLFKIDIKFINIRQDEDCCLMTNPTKINAWFHKNIDKFEKLAKFLTEEIFHILFSNKSILWKVSNIAAEGLKEIKGTNDMLSKNGRVRRINIPPWVQRAVFHRDKGKCGLCHKDLTNILSSEKGSSFDHTVALNNYGSNDPINIQLICRDCNVRKSSSITGPSENYIPWFDLPMV